MNNTADPSFANGALDGYLSRNSDRWHGFRPDGMNVLSRHYHFHDAEGRARRGTDRVEYRYRALMRPDFDQPFLFHFFALQLVFVETEYWSLDSKTCQQLTNDLGPPDNRLDAYFRDSVIANAEWVYPKRGLTLCVIPETGLIARWTAFAPQSLHQYEKRIRPIDLAREFELEAR